MKVTTQNQQILCAYALLFTVAGGIVVLDPVQRAAEPALADITLPQMVAQPEPKPEAVDSVRLAGQFTPTVVSGAAQ